jgi:hypothetical protein
MCHINCKAHRVQHKTAHNNAYYLIKHTQHKRVTKKQKMYNGYLEFSPQL